MRISALRPTVGALPRLARHVLAILGILALVPATAAAQTLRGVVVDQGDVPVPGVVLQLLDSAAHTVARALTNEHGEYRLAAPRAGTYRVTTLRIGYRPATSPAVALLMGGQATQRIVLDGVRVSLDTMRTESANVCRAFTDSGAATYRVWEQARAALTATQLTAGTGTADRSILATTVAYERTLDPDGRRVRKQESTVRSDYVTQPWRELPTEALHRDGYVVIDRDGATLYYAPGLDMLLSPTFIEDHCFRITSDKARFGIAFEPAPTRRGVPEIKGTLWIDRASSELRSLEFRYVSLASSRQEENAGGEVGFARLRNGGWAISAWNIRMPVMEQRVASQSFGGISERVLELHVTGGDLALARRGDDTLWMHAPLAFHGTVVDSASGDALSSARVSLAGTHIETTADARGRFTLSGALPGEYAVQVRTASLDSARAVHQSVLMFADTSVALTIRVPTAAQIAAAFCGIARRDLPGVVIGNATTVGDTAPPRNVPVYVEWTDIVVRENGGTDRLSRSMETRTDAHGAFRFCGVPRETRLVLTSASSGPSAPVEVRIPADARFARVDLQIDPRPSTTGLAVFSGVVIDSTQKPIVAAEVSITDLSKTVMTDERGAFRIAEVSPGAHRVMVRHLGFGAYDGDVTFAANAAMDRRFVLSKVTSLDSVVTTAKTIDPVMREFEENMKVGLGHFLLRADLAKVENLSTAAVLTQVSGVRLISGRSNQGWIVGKRGFNCLPGDGNCLKAHAGMIYVPQGFEKFQGMEIACYAQVYLDGQRMNPGSPADPFDVNTIPVAQIEAIEVLFGSVRGSGEIQQSEFDVRRVDHSHTSVLSSTSRPQLQDLSSS